MTAERVIWPEHIVQDPGVMAGKPVIKGTRIPVERIIAHLAHEPTLDDLFAAYPELTIEDVKAALEYAHVALLGPGDDTAQDDSLHGPESPL